MHPAWTRCQCGRQEEEKDYAIVGCREWTGGGGEAFTPKGRVDVNLKGDKL
jgi:hypothetical protein